MKKKLLVLFILLLCLTGCDFKEDFSDRYVYTTLYPIEYATQMLYGDYGTINSVYPNGSDSKYEISDKKKAKYADAEIFVYSGIANEASLARDIIKNNNINGIKTIILFFLLILSIPIQYMKQFH